MNRDVNVYIEDIFESLNRVKEYSEGVSREEFFSDHQLQDAIIRRFEIVGEATKQVPDETRDKYPDLPWREMAGLRDVLIHQYSRVSMKRIWNIIENDLDDLIARFSKVVEAVRAEDKDKK
jgi:uncharacterized protein with HEPN domain